MRSLLFMFPRVSCARDFHSREKHCPLSLLSEDQSLLDKATKHIRRLVKRLLRKYEYPPPEGQEQALVTVMAQCEQWADQEYESPLIVTNVTIKEEIHYHPGSVHVDNSTNISLNPQN